MVRGRVKGRYWATKRVATLPQGALLEVELENGSHIIAFDPLGCGDGEQVLITQGSVAAGYFDKIRAPVDALIIGSLDEVPPSRRR
ncbi:MAG: ethanolamine utilization protein EutN [Alphaproteobacteria bacterium]|nr:MAG: ethanolamine utilization protein EutN [Alphaproteobacteria bacterium]